MSFARSSSRGPYDRSPNRNISSGNQYSNRRGGDEGGEYNQHRRYNDHHFKEPRLPSHKNSRGDYSRRNRFPEQDEAYLEQRKKSRQEIFEESAEIWARSPTILHSQSSDEDDQEHLLAKIAKSKKKEKKEKEENEIKNKRKKRKRERRSTSESDDLSTDSEKRSKKKKKEKKKKNKKKKSHKKSSSHQKKKKSRKAVTSAPNTSSSDEWEEVPHHHQIVENDDVTDSSSSGDDVIKLTTSSVAEEVNDVIIGPLPQSLGSSDKPINFGHALLPGEGAAMAAFVSEGKRIPRRGEIGLTSNEISHFEEQGFVMSGSRHRRMEAVRLRKENQIYSADEKRALASFNKLERDKRESRIITQFKELVKTKQSQD